MINWDRVNLLREDVGHEDFDEIVDLFLVEVDEMISGLTAPPRSDDLHFLKGAALNLGFDDFSTACSEGEKMAANGKAESVDLAALRDLFATSRSAFLSGLPSALAG